MRAEQAEQGETTVLRGALGALEVQAEDVARLGRELAVMHKRAGELAVVRAVRPLRPDEAAEAARLDENGGSLRRRLRALRQEFEEVAGSETRSASEPPG